MSGGAIVAFGHARRAKSDEMAAGNVPRLIRMSDPHRTGEFANVVLIRPAGSMVADVGEPLQKGRHFRKPPKLHLGQHPRAGLDKFCRRCWRWCLHISCFTFDNVFHQELVRDLTKMRQPFDLRGGVYSRKQQLCMIEQ